MQTQNNQKKYANMTAPTQSLLARATLALETVFEDRELAGMAPDAVLSAYGLYIGAEGVALAATEEGV